jgi:hypothetical protein
VILLDSERGTLAALVAEVEWRARGAESVDLSANSHGLGRELFDVFRASATGAEQGAVSCGLPQTQPLHEPHAAPAPVHDHFALSSAGRAS